MFKEWKIFNASADESVMLQRFNPLKVIIHHQKCEYSMDLGRAFTADKSLNDWSWSIILWDPFNLKGQFNEIFLPLNF